MGPNYRDGIDGSFCSTPYEPPTNVSTLLALNGVISIAPIFETGPWNDSSTQTFVEVGCIASTGLN